MANKTKASNPTASIFNYPAALCREQHAKSDGSIFHSISFRFRDNWASFILNEDMIQPSTRRNGDIIPDRYNLILGEPDDIRFVSIRNADDSFERKAMFNKTILASINEERKSYLQSIAI